MVEGEMRQFGDRDDVLARMNRPGGAAPDVRITKAAPKAALEQKAG